MIIAGLSPINYSRLILDRTIIDNIFANFNGMHDKGVYNPRPLRGFGRSLGPP